MVYHGQIISNIELQTIRENVGELVSLNSFTSTTITNLEQKFLVQIKNTFEGGRVLSHIKVNRNITNLKPFADISLLSQFIDEKEVLFMARSVFKINSANPFDAIHV